MIAEPQILGALSLASHRDGSPIVLPRAKDETVMLAFDQRKRRLVELHVYTGKPAPQTNPAEAAIPTRRWVRPESTQLRQKTTSTSTRFQGRFHKFSGRRRLVQASRVRARYLHRFYQPQGFTEAVADVPAETLDAEQSLRACELLREAARVQAPSFMTVLESGMDDDMPYYVTQLNDGEFVQDYIRRRGALPTVTALALVKQLLKDLSAAEEHHSQLLCSMRLERVLVTSQEEQYLQLQLFDYGLSNQVTASKTACPPTLIRDCCRLLFLLLTGQDYAGGNPENFGVIAELPSALRFLLRQVLSRPSDSTVTLKTLRTEVREALCSLVNLAQARNPRSLLVADDSSLPLSHLQHLLLGNIPLKTLFGASFRIEHPELAGCHPFAIPAVNVCGSQDVTLHLLPPGRIVSQSDFSALPSQAWRQDAARQPNLLHMIQHWQGPDWAFLSEPREPGMSLGSLMARRGTLNPVEVTLLLRQIHSGLEQALDSGVQHVDLEPEGIQLCVGYDGPVLPRDLERLHQKRLDVWPKFMVKLRLHKTMRSLCQPRLIDPGVGDFGPVHEADVIGAREERQRSLICLAAYLLSGQGQMRSISEFPVSVPASASSYLLESLQSIFIGAPLPATADFTERLCQLLTLVYADKDDAEPAVLASGELESAGFVSDFEEDWPAESATAPASTEAPRHMPVAPHIKPFDLYQRPARREFHFPWLALSATLLLLGALAWMIFGEMPGPLPQDIVSSRASSDLENAAPALAPAGQAEARPVSLPGPVPTSTLQMTEAVNPVAAAPAPAAKTPVSPAPPVPQPAAPEPVMTVASAVAENIPVEKMSPALAEVSQDTELENSAATPAQAEPETPALDITIKKPVPITTAASNAAPSLPVAKEAPQARIVAAPSSITLAAPAAAPAAPESSQPVTIRQAIVLSPEEIRQALLEQPKPKKRRISRR
ncbi:hypothetical protein [Prosthecobacter vanneervenii]|uniref:Serine/threonine protein kinase n=1 Tax=Prosthecobacter vanneervenii TaxID=48466 RepID=A0A7W7Y9G5_9BACT|nr:hypothetical protein [Prosthecobacter vanneervenii]MBB5032098.1 serine/threonine protein kinase [Prosthecobacter vanneervenii]